MGNSRFAVRYQEARDINHIFNTAERVIYLNTRRQIPPSLLFHPLISLAFTGADGDTALFLCQPTTEVYRLEQSESAILVARISCYREGQTCAWLHRRTVSAIPTKGS